MTEDAKTLPIERFEARLAQELEERTEFDGWGGGGEASCDVPGSCDWTLSATYDCSSWC